MTVLGEAQQMLMQVEVANGNGFELPHGQVASVVELPVSHYGRCRPYWSSLREGFYKVQEIPSAG